MQYPNHIILDISKNKSKFQSQYWIFSYLFTFTKNKFYFNNFIDYNKFIFKKENIFTCEFIRNQKKYSIRYNLTNKSVFLSEIEKKLYLNLFKPKLLVKNRVKISSHISKQIYDYLINEQTNKNKNTNFDEKSISKYINIFLKKKLIQSINDLNKNNKLWNLFDINFLKKEKIYTKLKYSRTPQYDMVSGGSAALLSGFLGFLISEKFGFELIDSGDFYFLFMYLVFLIFFIRPLIKITTGEYFLWNCLSLKWLYSFYKINLLLFFKFFKCKFKNLYFFFFKFFNKN